jgi:NADH:ubiquinone oxidoreductase subunit 4 (subunit M)
MNAWLSGEFLKYFDFVAVVAALIPGLLAFESFQRQKNRSIWLVTVAGALVMVLAVVFGAMQADRGPWLLITAVTAFVLVLCCSRGAKKAATIFKLMFPAAAAIGFFTVTQPLVQLLYFAAATLPIFCGDASESDHHEIPLSYLMLQIASVVFFALGIGLAKLTTFGLDQKTGIFISESCFVTAAWLRLGLFPFHRPLVAFATKASMPAVLPMMFFPLGSFLMMQHLPSLAGGNALAAGIIFWVSVAACLHHGFAALGRRKLRTSLVYVSSLLLSLMTACLTINDLGFMAGELLALTVYTAIFGFGLGIWLIERRFGTEKYLFAENQGLGGGYAGLAPRLAGGFLFLTLAMIAAPFTVGFIAENAWMQTLGKESIFSVFVVLLGLTLASAATFYSYQAFFLGPQKRSAIQCDLMVREKLALCIVFVVIIFAGLGIPRNLTQKNFEDSSSMDIHSNHQVQ